MRQSDPKRPSVTLDFRKHDQTLIFKIQNGFPHTERMLRGKEFVYHSWVRKFWGENQADQFNSYMKSVRKFDSTIHSLNDEFEAVNINGSKLKIDRKRAEEALKIMKPALENMRL